jgi:hypothetical protein
MRIDARITQMTAILAATVVAAAAFWYWRVERSDEANFGASVQDFDQDIDLLPPRIKLPDVPPLPATIIPGMNLRLGVPVRVDDRRANGQNWEPSVVVVRPSVHGAGKDQVAVLWTQGRELPSNQTDTHLMQARTSNGGESYAASEFPLPVGVTGIPFDVMTAFDPVSNSAYAGAMATTGASVSVWVTRQTSAQNDFGAGVVANSGAHLDKGWTAAGPLPGNPQAGVLYLTYNSGLQRSLDGGLNFSAPPLPIDPGTGFQPRVQLGGQLTISYWASTGGQARMVTSSNGGTTLSAPLTIGSFSANLTALMNAVPGNFRIAPFVIHARDPNNGTLYVVYNDVTSVDADGANVDIVLQKSTNGGANWSARAIVNSDSSPTSDQFHPWLEVDASGRLHLIYQDVRRQRMPDNSTSGFVDVYYSLSEDGGTSWQEQRLTSTPIDSSLTNWSPFGPGTVQFVGDYLGIGVSPHAVYLAYPGDDQGQVAMYMLRVDLDDTIFSDGFQ